MDVGGTHWPHEYKPRGSLIASSQVRDFQAAPLTVRSLVGECPPPTKPTAEAMAAMEKANELEAAGDLAGSKEWIDKAVALGHNCLAEYGGWK